ncbi:hypothetical protein K443DRAFT_671457 [Laccaria amethystina LaAM-08-1]|uniref:Uncharacterized protein n=1 Tax=Laccaria amethystina LaAM-08-1 TaxID=1095629 RepID=A0A0C9XX55_9AGAR|nr:hypothetical protein K443DRAFT_671457 [Laccaria amethystina LaAM-08-1]
MLSSPYSSLLSSTRYDDKGRQLHFIETGDQRRERIEFSKMFRSEWAEQDSSPPREYAMSTLSPKHHHIGLHRSSSDDMNFGSDMGRELETYLIYSSHSTPTSPPPVSFAPLPPSPRGRGRQHSSLSSIPEES